MVTFDENEHDNPAAMPRREQNLELMKKRQFPIRHRDVCGHILLKLDWCRRENYFHPDRCTDERHLYEECEYIAWKDRVRLKRTLKAQEEADLKLAEAAAKAAKK